MYVIANSERLELKKHIATVHCSNTLSLLERKIANALLYHAYPKLMDQDFHEIHIPYLSKLVRYNSKDFKTLKKALLSLIGVVIEWDVINIDSAKQSVWNASSFIASASICGSWCTYSYSKQMRDFLYQPDFYAQLDMGILSKFKSSYGLALYETCARYQGVKKTRKMSLKIFRKLMGIKDGKYMVFRDLKRRVLDKAVLEINIYSNLEVKANIEKGATHGIIKSIQFVIEKKLSPNNKLLEKENPSKPINHAGGLEDILLDDFGFSEKKAENLMLTYSKEKIFGKIKTIKNSNSYNAGKIKNLAAYLIHALKENYENGTSSKEISEKIRRNKEKALLDQNKKYEKMEEYRQYQVKTIFKNHSDLSTKDKKYFSRLFSEYIQDTMYAKHFLKVGLNDPVIKDRMCDFVRGKGKSILNGRLSADVISFTEFIKINN